MPHRNIWFWIAGLITLLVVLASFGILPVHLPGGFVGWLGIAVLILILGVYPWT
jgi:hypothetical protein